MIKLPHIYGKHMLNVLQLQEAQHKLIFTRIIFVSLHPRIIRMLRIEKDMANGA